MPSRAARQESRDEQARRKVERMLERLPQPDQHLWHLLYPRQRGVRSRAFDPAHPPGWVRRANVLQIVLRFNDFVVAEHPSLATLPFPERVTADVMVTFADELGEDCSEGTICDYLVEICRFAQACDPEVCLRSIKLEARRYGRRRNRRKKRLNEDAHRLWSLIEEKLDAIEKDIASTSNVDEKERRKRANHYRNLLQCGFLLKLPLRLKNLRSLGFDHFPLSDLAARCRGDRTQYHADDKPLFVRFAAREMKNRQPYSTNLPGVLARRIRFYVEEIRGDLADDVDPAVTALWIAPSGQGESAIGIHQCIVRTTIASFAARLTAHDFRHIVASTAAAQGLGRPAIALLLQQVINSRTVERYISSWSDKPLRDQRTAIDALLEALPGLARLDARLLAVANDGLVHAASG